MPEALNDRVCRLYALTFAPALMLLIDGPDSHGVYVRPRQGRLELCGEYVQGARLGAAAAFLAGSARACAAADVGEASAVAQLPPRLRLRLLPATERYGLYVGRRAFGCDLYASGRRALLTREGGGTITAQEHLELAWQAASGALAGIATGSNLGVADRIVTGSLPLGIEAPVARR